MLWSIRSLAFEAVKRKSTWLSRYNFLWASVKLVARSKFASLILFHAGDGEC